MIVIVTSTRHSSKVIENKRRKNERFGLAPNLQATKLSRIILFYLCVNFRGLRSSKIKFFW